MNPTHVNLRVAVVMLGVMALTACGTSIEEPTEAELAVMSQESVVTYSYTDIGSATGTNVVNGNTCNAANEVTPSCAAGSSSDLTYAWTAPSSTGYKFTAIGSKFNPVLVIKSSTGSVLACSNSGTTTSSATLNVSAGSKLFITVDGASGACGSFQLDITTSCVPRTCGWGACGTMSDGCGGTLNCGGCLSYCRDHGCSSSSCFSNSCSCTDCGNQIP